MKTKISSFFIFLLLFTNVVSAQQKQIISKAEDLPKHSYKLETKDAVVIVKSKEKILEIAEMIKSNLESDLAKYDIQDNSALKDYYSTLRIISAIQGEYSKALAYIDKERELADKESERILKGAEMIALLESAIKLNTFEAEKLSESMLGILEEKLSVEDFTMIQENIEESKGQTEILSENLLWGIIQGDFQTAINNNKDEIPGDLVASLLGYYYSLNYYLPYQKIYNKAYTNALDKYVVKVEKINIWNERDVTLKKSGKYDPTIIAIWDSGVDTDIFEQDNLWVNKQEKKDGKDNDGNGFIDDINGIAYDIESNKDTHYLEQIAHNSPNIKELQGKIKGLMDLQANIDSDDAIAFKKFFSTLKPEEVSKNIEALGLYGNYSHGTHVAGITIAGNPMAKLMVARITFDHKNIPDAITDAFTERVVKMYAETITYFKTNKVQVVNMSWGISFEEILNTLVVNGIGESDEERKAMAKRYFDLCYNAFKKAIESAPEILFVCAAGNSNDDVDFTGDYPSSINLPNILTVGAVDIEGKKTSFTTEGKSVDVYANGYEVMSYVPGGDKLAFSGTSMASPMVVNLAGKILAVNNKLSPEDVIDIITKTATKSEEDENVLLIHPKNAVKIASKK